jgi:hypothetical protein
VPSPSADRRLERLVATLEAVAEELADLAVAELRDAIDAAASLAAGSSCGTTAEPSPPEGARHGRGTPAGRTRGRIDGPALEAERRLSRARRSVQRAVAILRAGQGDEPDAG